MGAACCGPIEPAQVINRDINSHMKADKEKGQQIYKLLLLGAGESGKSTLLKQMRNIHGQGYRQEEYIEAKPYIIQNCIEAMRMLAIYSEMLWEEGLDTKVSKENEEIRTRVAMMTDKHVFTTSELKDFEVLWKDPGIQKTFDLRNRYQLIDTAPYLFSKINEFVKPNYIPDFDDLIHSRKRTTGVSKVYFEVRNSNGQPAESYELFDVGGQRNERKKWLHVFDGVAAIIFVAALSGYDQLLWEDNRVNRMRESLQLFDSIVNMECFDEAHTILFLNKSDLFEEKIKTKSLKLCFPEFEGRNNDRDSAIKFIEERFSERRRNPRKIIYSHITCATDTQNIYRVFDSVRDIVVRKELGRAGLL